MKKFDASCGLTKNQVQITKYQIKNAVERKIPVLPEFIETKLFFQGRDAYTYRWGLIKTLGDVKVEQVSLEVVVKLKTEFHSHLEQKVHKFFL